MSLFETAKKLVDEDRQKDYGNPQKLWSIVAKGWEIIFSFGISARTCIMAMLWLKLARELIKPKKDNRDDLGGYLLILDRLEDNNEQTIQGSMDTEGDLSPRPTVVDGEDTVDRDSEPAERGGLLGVKSILGRISRSQ